MLQLKLKTDLVREGYIYILFCKRVPSYFGEYVFLVFTVCTQHSLLFAAYFPFSIRSKSFYFFVQIPEWKNIRGFSEWYMSPPSPSLP